jgi:K+-sensing histidine kinase KdpD
MLAPLSSEWRIQLSASSRALASFRSRVLKPSYFYIYLFPVALVATLYNGRPALLATAIALICADYFLQKPLYVLRMTIHSIMAIFLFSPQVHPSLGAATHITSG